MPILKTSANLNLFGNAGQFETDPSTWGFSIDYSKSRFSGQKTAGNYSCRAVNTGSAGFTFPPFNPTGFSQIGWARFPGNFKKYIITVNIYTPSSAQVAPDHCNITLQFLDFVDHTDISISPLTIGDCKDNWRTLTYKVQFTSGGFLPLTPGQNINVALYITSAGGDVIPIGGTIYLDQFEIYEYIDVASDLDFNLPACSVTDDTGLSDGTITIATTGGNAPIQYSKDGGVTWQPGNNFAGLAVGTYTVAIKDTTGYTITHDFIINLAAVPFTFNCTVTNESVAGANNGKIVVNIVSGATGPFTFSKDGGANYQAGNTFTNLAPGNYNIFVKDSLGHTSGTVVTILAGTIVFEKIWWSRNPITYSASAAPGWGALTNVRIYNEITVDENTNGTYVSRIKMDIPPDSAGNVIFYNNEALENSLKAVPPGFNTTAIVRLTDRLKLFKNNTAQLQDDQTTPLATTPSLPHLVLLGGLSKLAWASIDYFLDYLPTQKKFLTWAPSIKPVDSTQEDYLNYFVFTKNTVAIQVQIKAYYDDGTNQTSVIASLAGVQYGQLYQIPAGPLNTGAALINPAKNLLSYELSLLDQDDALISEVRTYVLDKVSHPLKRFFLFLNSLGSYEVLRFTGVADNSVIVSKMEIAKFLPYNYNALDGEFEFNDVTIRESNSFSTGYLKDKKIVEWNDYMKDLLLSRRVFEVTTGTRVPVQIQPATFPIKSDHLYQNFIRFTALDAYQDENYTPKNL